jgi:small GTP-binding protein
LFLADTLGLTEFDRLRRLSYVNTDIALICFNVDDPQSLTNVIEKWMPEIRHFCPRSAVILVACKIDLREDPETILRLNQRGEKPIKTASKIHADVYIECSAKTHEGVQELFVNTATTHLALKKTLLTPTK